MHSLFITGERGIWLLRWDLFRCQAVNIWLMTPFLFTMTYYMKMTQETTRTRESIVLELVSKNSLFSLTAQPVGYSRSYRRGSWVVKTSNRSTGIKSDWHDVVTSSLSSDHTITICSQRSSGSLLYQIERESNKGGSDEALGKPELTHGWLAPSSTPNKWNLFLILFFIWSNRRVFDYFYI